MSSVCTILIIDDEADLLEMYRDFFEMEDFTVFAESSAKAGLEILEARPEIQVVVSDSHMNGMSGLDLLKILNEKNTKKLFYLATGDLDESDDNLKALGATGLLTKPFDMGEVIKRILKDLNGKA
jgi:DNA-binding response OmpR family regulator